VKSFFEYLIFIKLAENNVIVIEYERVAFLKNEYENERRKI